MNLDEQMGRVRGRLLSCVVLGVLAAAVASAQIPQSGSRPGVSYFNPPELTRSPRYSHAAAVEGRRLVFVSGELALDASGNLVGKGDFRAQADRVFANLGAALHAAGATVDDVVSITTHLVRLGDLAAYRDSRQAFFGARKDPPPTSTTVVVAGLVVEGALLEVSVVAAPTASPPRQAIKGVAVLRAREVHMMGDVR